MLNIDYSSVSGCTDYFADTEYEAFSITRSIFGSFNSNLGIISSGMAVVVAVLNNTECSL